VSGALGTVTWSVASGNLPDGLSLDPLSGEIAGTPTMWGTKTAVIQAKDSDRWGLNRVVLDTVTITVAPAPIQIVTSALPAGVLRSHYDAALSATGGTGLQTWSLIDGLLPPGLVLGTSGSVTGDPQSIGRFTFTVQVKDDWPGHTDSGTVTLVIAPLPIAITTATLPPGNVPRPYRAVLEFTGGTGHTTWSLVEGQLPKGLELSPDGIISGRPKAVGTFSFTVQASDVGWDGNVARRTFSLTIRAREVVLYASDANIARSRPLVSIPPHDSCGSSEAAARRSTTAEAFAGGCAGVSDDKAGRARVISESPNDTGIDRRYRVRVKNTAVLAPAGAAARRRRGQTAEHCRVPSPWFVA
jgi:putative Ig domain-containing protein